MSERRDQMYSKTKNASIIMILLLIVLVGFSVAKYNEIKTFSDAISNAKWIVNLSNSAITRDTYDVTKVVAGKMAPGTSGTFKVVVDATGSETAVKYDVSFGNVQNKPANLYFEVDGKKYATLDEVATNISGEIASNSQSKVVTKTITWKWDYETTKSLDGSRTTVVQNDAQDTLDGKAAKTMSFDMTVHAYQIDPQ